MNAGLVFDIDDDIEIPAGTAHPLYHTIFSFIRKVIRTEIKDVIVFDVFQYRLTTLNVPKCLE